MSFKKQMSGKNSNRFSRNSGGFAPDFLHNEYFRIIALSVLMSIILVLAVFGFYGMICFRELPVPYSVLILLAAVVFIPAMIYFDKARNDGKLIAAGLGFITSVCVTVLAASVLESFVLVWRGSFSTIGIGMNITLTAFAIGLVVSAILIKIVSGLTGSRYDYNE